MANYLIDANHLSTLITADHPMPKRVLRQIRFGDSFSIAAPALTEMLYGIQTAPRAKQNMIEWQKLNVAFHYYPIDRQDAEQAASLQVKLRERGWQLGTVDALIATIALRHRLILLTTDSDFSEITGLQVENWVSSK